MTLAMKALLPFTLVVLSGGPGHPVRLLNNPIVTPASSPTLGASINGPSLLRVPPWVERPLGRYYLYFAHHAGRFIRLAYADRLSGPWKIHEPGTLLLEQAARCYDHIASPDMHVDTERREILMYFHCPAGSAGGVDIGQQKTFQAMSPDGLRFRADTVPLGPAYFRVFRRGEYYYAVVRGGGLLRSRDRRSVFEPGPTLLPPDSGRLAAARSRRPASRCAAGLLLSNRRPAGAHTPLGGAPFG